MEFRKRCKQINSVISFPVKFDGGLQSSVRAELINELLKYIIYERQQTPLPFDAIKREVEEQDKLLKGRQGGSKVQLRKKTVEFVSKLTEGLSRNIKAFESCPEIQKVAIIIGATPVSPKEVFVIDLPPLNPEAENLSVKVCVKTLFRELITCDPMREYKQASPTNVNIMINAPRNSHLDGFFPKPTYKLPSRGKHFHFQFLSKYGQGIHDLSKDYSVVELSGFEPFDISVDDLSVLSSKSPSIKCGSHSSEDSISKDYICVDSQGEQMDIGSQNSNTHCTSVDESVSFSDLNASSSTSLNPSSSKLMKSTSASSILSQSSVMGQSQRSSTVQEDMEFEDVDTGVFSFSATENIWFQSPVTLKGFKHGKIL